MAIAINNRTRPIFIGACNETANLISGVIEASM